MITKEIAITLRHGAILHHVRNKNRDGTPQRIRVTGKCKTWKTRPEKFELPVKYGLYQSGYVSNGNMEEWEVA